VASSTGTTASVAASGELTERLPAGRTSADPSFDGSVSVTGAAGVGAGAGHSVRGPMDAAG
jgi:hypothetical protein